MGVDGNLRDPSCRELVGPLHLERRGSGLDFQGRRKIRQDWRGCDLLVNFHDALAKKIFNEMEDRTAVTREQSAYRREFPIDVDLCPAHRWPAAPGGVAQPASGKPFLSAGDPGPGRKVAVNPDHLDGVDNETDIRCERHKIVDGGDFVNE